MKNLWINKQKILSIILAGTITLCTGCGKKSAEKERLPEETPSIIIDSGIYVGKNNVIVNLNVLNNDEYKKVEGYNRYGIYPGANIYFKDGCDIASEIINEQTTMVTAIESNGTYTLVTMPDGRCAYANSNQLIKCVNLTNSEYVPVFKSEDRVLLSNAYLYDGNGMYMQYLYENQSCQILATNGEYALITLPDGTHGYVVDEAVMKDYRRIDGFGFIRKGTSVYSNKTLTNIAYAENIGQMVTVLYVNDTYVAIIDNNSQDVVYVRLGEVDSNFIDINLNEQKMECYLNYHLANSFRVRTGKDSSPTHVCIDAIDEKVKDFDFPKHPGRHADYFIVYNEEAEECIHDLDGDDEENYGNQSYHEYGSLGCTRTPKAGSRFVYENYEVGDIVRVRAK